VKTDNEGYLYFVGRNDTLIKVGRIPRQSTEVEEALQLMRWRASCRSNRKSDELAGQHIGLSLCGVLIDVDESSLLQCCSRELPSFKMPREIRIRREPSNDAEWKVDYDVLRSR
jgi:acyl-CoA synthetase (AMP-forming)/AMP-acid ligase II